MGAMKGKLIIMVAAVALLLTAVTGYMWFDRGGTSVSNIASASSSLYSEDTVTAIYQNVSPAVVMIEVKQQATDFLGSYDEEGEGSGFLIDTEGHILTNNHVVENASKVEVLVEENKTVEAKVIGTDAADDLALIKVDASAVSGITPLTLGDSSAVKPGQMAIAVGNPYELEDSITVGVISGINRSYTGSTGRPMTGLLQTDAAINPGNSGGPLLNSQGEVVGINAAIKSPTTGAQGIGFAVPINMAKDQLPTLLKGQNVKRTWLGVSGMAISTDLVQKLGLSVDQGVYVVSVTADSPADKAGIKAGGTDSQGNATAGGDIITAVDGNAVKKVEDLVSYFNTKNVGDKVTLTVSRDGKVIEVKVTLGEWPETSPESQQSQPTPTPTPTPKVWHWQWPWSGK